MKNLRIISLVLLTLALTVTGFTACEWDTSDEPDHPIYVSYSITAGSVTFAGPEQLLADIQTWVKANQSVYDKNIANYTGEASDFIKTDAEAVKKYDEFAPKFRKYLDEDVTEALKAGKYDDTETNTPATVQAVFFTSASRVQGKDGHLKYEEIKYSYP